MFKHKEYFDQIDFPAFREKSLDNNKKIKFYYLEELNNKEAFLISEVFANFSEQNLVLKILISKDYYEASEMLFLDEVLHLVFEYWIQHDTMKKLRPLLKVGTFLPILTVFALNFMGVAWYYAAPVLIITIIFIVKLKMIVKKANKYRLEIMQLLGEERNNILSDKLNAYFKKKKDEYEKSLGYDIDDEETSDEEIKEIETNNEEVKELEENTESNE